MSRIDEIRARAAEFDQKMAEVDRVDVWPASDFDRGYLLKFADVLVVALEKHGKHYIACASEWPDENNGGHRPCNCGFSDALKFARGLS